MAKNKPVKAIVATVKIGDREVEGLQFPDGSYGIGIPQIQALFSDYLDSQNQASQKLKRLMGKEFKTHKTKTEFNKNITLAIALEQFEFVLAKLDRAGSVKAQDFRDELIGLSLQQLWSDAFNIKFEKEERQQWLSSRQQGKITRRTLTDAIKGYVQANAENLSDNYKKFIYNNCTDAVNRLVFGRSAKKLKEAWDCRDVRAAMTIEELMIVDGVERLAVTLIDDQGFEPHTAIKEAGNRLLIKKIER